MAPEKGENWCRCEPYTCTLEGHSTCASTHLFITRGIPRAFIALFPVPMETEELKKDERLLREISF